MELAMRRVLSIGNKHDKFQTDILRREFCGIGRVLLRNGMLFSEGSRAESEVWQYYKELCHPSFSENISVTRPSYIMQFIKKSYQTAQSNKLEYSIHSPHKALNWLTNAGWTT